MRNEELAIAIQNGEREWMGQLWEQVRRLVVKLLLPYAPDYTAQGNVIDLDDLTQAGFIAVWEAVQDFKPDGGYLFLPLISNATYRRRQRHSWAFGHSGREGSASRGRPFHWMSRYRGTKTGTAPAPT